MNDVYLALTIDCECDKGKGWRVRSPLRFEGVRDGIGRRLEPMFRSFGAKPTYLLSPELFRDAESLELLARQDAELGTHLHGEYAEPGAFEPEVTSAMQRDYPPGVEAAKLESLTDAFRAAFGGPPRAFRAGRFGLGPDSIPCLERLGYSVDSSVTPFVTWKDGDMRDLSYRGAPTQPYRPSRTSPGSPGEGALLEVPVTIRPRSASRVPWLGRFVPPRWLRPTHTPADGLLCVATEEIRSARGARASPVVLNAMFHNVEVIPGASPYAETEPEAEVILGRVRVLLEFAARESIRVVGLSDIAELFA